MPYVIRQDPERPIPPVVIDVLVKHGWEEYDEETAPEKQPPVSLFWKTNRFFPSEISAMQYPRQRVNHYPKSSEITKKDLLYRHMRRMKGVHGSAYDFMPTTFALPTEYVKFCQYYVEKKDAALDRGDKRLPVYICKPSELSRGRKIFCFDDIGELTYDCSSVVQEYVDRPLLVHGHKCDFRIYVLVTCFKPLRAYIFKEGLTRMSVEQYDMDDVKNIFAHLTNYSINKNSEQWSDVKEGIGAGCKWDFTQTKQHFEERGINFDVIFDRIECLVCLTLLSISNSVAPVAQCFELYGFDVLFDADFKPWLMEVNFSPALAVESDVDARVKEPLIWDLVQTLGIPPPVEWESALGDGTTPSGDAENGEANTTTTVEKKADTRQQGTTSAKTSPLPQGDTAPPQAPAKTAAVKKAVGSSGRPPVAGGRPAVSGGTRRTNGTSNSTTGTTTTLRSASSSRGPSFRTQPVDARRSSSSSRLTAGGGSASSSKSKMSSSSSSSSQVAFTDAASGLFKQLFPFNSTVEDLNKQMMDSSTPEKQARSIITEIRRRDAKNIAAIKGWTVSEGPKGRLQ